MHGFGGMKEYRRRAGGTQSRGNLARDDPALAHPADHDATATPIEQVNGAMESVRHGSGDPVRQGAERPGLNPDYIFPYAVHRKRMLTNAGIRLEIAPAMSDRLEMFPPRRYGQRFQASRLNSAIPGAS